MQENDIEYSNVEKKRQSSIQSRSISRWNQLNLRGLKVGIFPIELSKNFYELFNARMFFVLLCALIVNCKAIEFNHETYYESDNTTLVDEDDTSSASFRSHTKCRKDDEDFNKPPPTLSLTTVDVCASAGCMRGKVEKGRLRPYDAFYGIPYAEPPVGDLRLENPIPFKGWEGDLDATNSQSDCIQRNYFLYTGPILGTENCLYLNVYRPQRRGFNKLPVFVWIHGGSLNSFSSSPDQFGPEYLMDNGEVILVTLNYRLGMFGLLCSGDEAVKGNFALKDQQLALKWVADNIEAFGGNVNAVTIAGQSSGASSVMFHMMNPVSSALFHRVIIMSGSAVAPWAYGIDWVTQFRTSARNSGMQNWNTATTSEIAKFFKDADPYSLILAFDQLFIFPLAPSDPMVPCVEGNWEGAFLTENPRKLWAEGKYSHKPILTGSTTTEGLFASPLPMSHTDLKQYNQNIREFLPMQLDIEPQYVNDVIEFYLGKDSVDDSNIDAFYQMIGDRAIYYPLYKTVNQFLRHADVQKNPVYIYEFGFKSPYTFVKYYTGKDVNIGVAHLDDLIFLFSMSAYFSLINPKSPEGVMSDIWVKTIVGFITEGVPKTFTPIKPCTSYTNKPFCEYQAFKRYTKSNPDSVRITSSDEINQRMVDLWKRIDRNAFE